MGDHGQEQRKWGEFVCLCIYYLGLNGWDQHFLKFWLDSWTYKCKFMRRLQRCQRTSEVPNHVHSLVAGQWLAVNLSAEIRTEIRRWETCLVVTLGFREQGRNNRDHRWLPIQVSMNESTNHRLLEIKSKAFHMLGSDWAATPVPQLFDRALPYSLTPQRIPGSKSGRWDRRT